MTSGLVADVRIATPTEGPGSRVAVVLKGCPLSCMWCHSPENRLRRPQRLHVPGGVRLVGRQYDPAGLAETVRTMATGASVDRRVTLTGGEPLLQAAFVAETIDTLPGWDVTLDTSGYGRDADLRLLLPRSHLVLYDLKLMDPVEHRAYTGANNGRILANLQLLASSGVPYVIRVPLIPGVTDSTANLSSIAHRVAGLPGLLGVELLAFDTRASARHEAAGLAWRLELDEPRPVDAAMAPFVDAGVAVSLAA